MAREDAALLVDQHRVGPPELHHARRDLVDLRVRVRARVALVRAQAVDRPSSIRSASATSPMLCGASVTCEPHATAATGAPIDRMPDASRTPACSPLCSASAPLAMAADQGSMRSRRGARRQHHRDAGFRRSRACFLRRRGSGFVRRQPPYREVTAIATASQGRQS